MQYSQNECVEIERTLEVMPNLQEKFIVDFVNNIDVIKDQNESLKSIKIKDRLLNFFNGRIDSKVNQMNSNIAVQLESSFKWLCKLTEQVTFSNKAITMLSKQIEAHGKAINDITEYSLATRQYLEQFAVAINDKVETLEANLQYLDLRVKAREQCDYLIAKYEARKYEGLNAAQICYVIIDELNWGYAGEYVRRSRSREDVSKFLDYVRNKLIGVVVSLLGTEASSRIKSTEFIALNAKSEQTIAACKYLANDVRRNDQPFSYWAIFGNDLLKDFNEVPFIMKKERLVNALVGEHLIGVCYE